MAIEKTAPREVWLIKGNVRMAQYPMQDANIYDVRNPIDEIYQGGWFSCGWFPADIWWGEGSN